MSQIDITLPTCGVPVGTIIGFALLPANIPANWLLCNGAAIDSGYPLAGYMTNTPNLCGVTLIGSGSNYPLGSTGGEATHTLIEAEMPSHTHSYTYSNPTGSTGLYGGSYWGPSSVTGTTGGAGSGDPHNNMQPYYVVNYIIYAGAPS